MTAIKQRHIYTHRESQVSQQYTLKSNRTETQANYSPTPERYLLVTNPWVLAAK